MGINKFLCENQMSIFYFYFLHYGFDDFAVQDIMLSGGSDAAVIPIGENETYFVWLC